MNVAGFLYPIATLDAIIGELEDTNRSLLRLGELQPSLSADWVSERKHRLLWLRSRLEFQRDRMIEQGAQVSGNEAA